MLGNFGAAIRFFLIGLGVGLLTAPRSGEETRRLLGNRLQGVGEWWQGMERAYPTPTPTEQMAHEGTHTTETGYRTQPPQA